ncbi:ribonuclease E inhibitor RraB [Spongisporangium articulatum]|uniref:Ribonuclease E inhibitor RraB n=1 Tax=Spongisporangium articulatum TaxID=3362603 RepID=A0ABW8AJK9_9ACTN
MTDEAGEDKKAKNHAMWDVMTKDHGLTEGASLDADLFWFATDRPAADALAEALATEGIAATVDEQTHGWLRRRTVVSVHAVLHLARVDLATLDAMVERMEVLGDRYGVEFDGWGAAVPDRP